MTNLLIYYWVCL